MVVKRIILLSGGTTGSTPPTWDSAPLARSDGGVTWSYIGAVDTRLYLYGYNSEATKPPYKLQGYNLGARINDVLYVSLIDGVHLKYTMLMSHQQVVLQSSDKTSQI